MVLLRDTLEPPGKSNSTQCKPQIYEVTAVRSIDDSSEPVFVQMSEKKTSEDLRNKTFSFKCSFFLWTVIVQF